jgi:hypothetical protein
MSRASSFAGLVTVFRHSTGLKPPCAYMMTVWDNCANVGFFGM